MRTLAKMVSEITKDQMKDMEDRVKDKIDGIHEAVTKISKNAADIKAETESVRRDMVNTDNARAEQTNTLHTSMMAQMSAMFTSMKDENKKDRARTRQDMAKVVRDSDSTREASKAKRSRKSPGASPSESNGDPKTPREDGLNDIREDSDAEMADSASSKPPDT